jgi:hypothetical protein
MDFCVYDIVFYFIFTQMDHEAMSVLTLQLKSTLSAPKYNFTWQTTGSFMNI